MLSFSGGKKVKHPFFRLHKGEKHWNSTTSPFWCHSKKDEVSSICLIGIAIFAIRHVVLIFCPFWRTTDRKVFIFLFIQSYTIQCMLNWFTCCLVLHSHSHNSKMMNIYITQIWVYQSPPPTLCDKAICRMRENTKGNSSTVKIWRMPPMAFWDRKKAGNGTSGETVKLIIKWWKCIIFIIYLFHFL